MLCHISEFNVLYLSQKLELKKNRGHDGSDGIYLAALQYE